MWLAPKNFQFCHFDILFYSQTEQSLEMYSKSFLTSPNILPKFNLYTITNFPGEHFICNPASHRFLISAVLDVFEHQWHNFWIFFRIIDKIMPIFIKDESQPEFLPLANIFFPRATSSKYTTEKRKFCCSIVLQGNFKKFVSPNHK